MKKAMGLFVFLIIIGIQFSNAQERQVTGTVTDASDGSPLPGVTVMVKGTQHGTATDVNGLYSLKVNGNAILVFSFVGMTPQEISTGTKSTIDVKLQNAATRMDEVVVTAIGIKKAEKTLGYAASTVKNDELVAARSSDVMSGVIGKVAGVNISNSGQTGSSQKVVVRGYSSFSSNQPLYVVDGVPIQNSFSGVGDFSGAVDFGNQSGDINPDDVESLTILKGASATALYGSRAANGVIMITTKRAQQEQKISVVYSGSFMGSDVLRVPQTQDMFGQGWPNWDRMENGSWGPKLDGRMHDFGAPINGVYREKPFSYAKDNLRNFYETGFEMTNSINISGGTKNTGFMLSYSNTTSDGVIPSDADKYDRNTFSFRGNTKYNRFEASYNINYVRKDVRAVSTGQGDDGATIFPELLQHAVDVDFGLVKDINNPYNDPDHYYTAYAANPYWVVANNGNKYQDDRVYGKVELAYEIIPGLKAIGRLGGDFTNSRQKRWNAIAMIGEGSYSADGGKKDEIGYYFERKDNWEQLDATALLSGNFKLSEDFGLDGTIGYNYNQRSTGYQESALSGLNVPGWYSFANGNTLPNTYSGTTRRRLIGVLGQFNLSFRDYWFVTGSVRNDWSSTLPIGKNSFFYWGVNTSLVLSDMIKGLEGSKVNFLKVRAAYGQTGNDAPTYRTNAIFEPTQIGLGFGSVYLPLNGVAGLTENDRIPNMGLKPEITTELEFGIDVRLFDNRLALDMAYYNKHTKDQIISATVPRETGYSSRTQNIGKIQNQGIEIALNVIPVKTTDFIWDLGVTFSKNYSKVKKVWAGSDTYRIGGGYDVDYLAIVGKPLGVFMAPTEARVESGEHAGKIIVNSQGLPLMDPNKKEMMGYSSPDFVMGFNTRFTYKGISLGAVLDWRSGGNMWSYTAHIMHFNGNATPTTFNDRQTFLVPNSVKTVNGEYVENNIPIGLDKISANYYNNSSNTPIQKTFVIPKDFVKLRELTLSYTLPKRLFDNFFVKGVEVGLVGRNLFLWTPKENNYVDPEGTNYGNDLYSEIGEFAAAPTTRNFGGNIKITF